MFYLNFLGNNNYEISSFLLCIGLFKRKETNVSLFLKFFGASDLVWWVIQRHEEVLILKAKEIIQSAFMDH